LSQPLERGMEGLLELTHVLWIAVCYRPLEVVPNGFVRVEFGRIHGEPIGMQTRMFSEELPDRRSLMVLAVVPQQNYMAAQVLEQLSEEGDHFGRPDVLLRMESGVEGEVLAFGRYRDCRDGRDLLPVSGTPQDRGLPARGPCPPDVGDRQEAAFIEKYQMSG